MNNMGFRKEIMMKHFFGILVSVIFLSSMSLGAYGAETSKIGIVDIQKFQEKSVAFQKLQEVHLKKLEPQGKELEKEQAALIKLEEELRQQSMMLSLDAKEGRRIELGKRSRRYKYLEDELRQDLKQAQVETIRVVGTDIQKIVEEIGKKQGYTMIMEKRGVGFLYNDENIDITDEVVKAYDKMHQ